MVKCSTKWSLILQPEQRGCKGHCIVTVKVKQGKDSITYTFVVVVTSCLNFVFYVVAGCQATYTGWWSVTMQKLLIIVIKVEKRDKFQPKKSLLDNSRHIMFTCHIAHFQLNFLTNYAIFHLQLPKRKRGCYLSESVGNIQKCATRSRWLEIEIEMWHTVINAPELCHIWADGDTLVCVIVPMQTAPDLLRECFLDATFTI